MSALCFAAFLMICTYLLHGDGLLRRLMQFLDCLWVKPQILLAANKDDGQARAEVKNLGDPLLLHTSISIRAHQMFTQSMPE